MGKKLDWKAHINLIEQGPLFEKVLPSRQEKKTLTKKQLAIIKDCLPQNSIRPMNKH